MIVHLWRDGAIPCEPTTPLVKSSSVVTEVTCLVCLFAGKEEKPADTLKSGTTAPRCPHCNGRGVDPKRFYVDKNNNAFEEFCRFCGGKGTASVNDGRLHEST